jgi:hypothetical protein
MTLNEEFEQYKRTSRKETYRNSPLTIPLLIGENNNQVDKHGRERDA